jgi:hypothetical protein
LDRPFDLRFKLTDDASGGTQIGGIVTQTAVPISDGYFTLELDFGEVFGGTARWLEIAGQGSGDVDFTTLSPRQALTPVPHAFSADRLDGMDGTAFAAAGNFNDPDRINNEKWRRRSAQAYYPRPQET